MALDDLAQETIDRRVAEGVWSARPLSATVEDLAGLQPDTLAVCDQHERLTYAELVRRSRNLAAWLLAHGLRPGAPVAVQSGNRVALALTHLACDLADLVFVPLSTAWRKTEVAHLLATSRAEVVLVPPSHGDLDHLATVTELAPSLAHLRLVGGMDGAGGEFDLAAVAGRGAGLEPPPRDPDQPRFVMVTSGTTGLPHMSLWSDNNLWYFMSTFIEAVQMGPGDVAVGLAPANTGATGYVFAVLGPILAGATSVLLERWDPAVALDLIESEHATHATAVPTQLLQLLQLLQDEAPSGRDFGALRTFTNAGAAMPPEAGRKVEQLFGCTQHVCYGATDGGVPAMLRYDDPPEKRYHTVGRVLPHTDVRLVDPLLKDVPEGDAGELLWRSPTKSFGYLNEPKRTAEAFVEDGWYRSGDVARLDEDGYLHIVGRVKDLIIRGGQNISPRELEDLVAAVPEVAEVAVIGVPDPVFGERVCACVTLRHGSSLTFETLVAHLRREQVAVFKLPERMEIFDELPKSVGGKVSKVELRTLVDERTR